MKAIKGYLANHHFEDYGAFLLSLFPSTKIGIAWLTVMAGALVGTLERLMGVDAIAFGALVLTMALELITGLWAAKTRKEPFESGKFSRFTLKLAVYFTLITLPFLMEQSFMQRDKDIAAEVFGWFHSFIVVEIVFEYLISISENVSVINCKPKDHWIKKVKEMITSKF